jgi:hypothetical protein
MERNEKEWGEMTAKTNTEGKWGCDGGGNWVMHCRWGARGKSEEEMTEETGQRRQQIQKGNEDVMVEETRQFTTNEGSRQESEEEMAEETRRHRRWIQRGNENASVKETKRVKWVEWRSEREGGGEMAETDRVSGFYITHSKSRPSMRSTIQSATQ